MIEGMKINIIGLNNEALNITYHWINQTDLKYSLGIKYPISQLEHQKWFDDSSVNKVNMVYAIQEKETNSLIGIIGNRETDQLNNNSKIFVYIGDEKSRGKGYALEAINLYVDFLFKQTNIVKVQSWIYQENIKSINLFEKAGFDLEGKFLNHWFKNGFYHNVLIYYKTKI